MSWNNIVPYGVLMDKNSEAIKIAKEIMGRESTRYPGRVPAISEILSSAFLSQDEEISKLKEALEAAREILEDINPARKMSDTEGTLTRRIKEYGEKAEAWLSKYQSLLDKRK